MTEKQIKATECFNQKMHCSQSVLFAFAKECGITEETAFRLGSCFGSGMRKGNVCGACTGALMVLGLMFGESHIGDSDERRRSNRLNDEFLNRFAMANGTFICNDLLGCDVSTPEGAQIKDRSVFRENLKHLSAITLFPAKDCRTQKYHVVDGRMPCAIAVIKK